MDSTRDLLDRIEQWLARHLGKRRAHDTNTMTVGLILAEILRDNPSPISLRQIESEKKSQVRGLSGPAIARILKEHGEHRPFTSEGGRTSRGSIVKAREVQQILNKWAEERKPNVAERKDAAAKLSEHFVNLLKRDYFDSARISAILDPSASISTTVHRLIEAAQEAGGSAAGAMIQHLVGAKLELRFPDRDIGKDSYAASDQSTGRFGDFQVGNIAYHVTMAPSDALFSRRVADNIKAHIRPVVLVPDARLEAAQQLAANAEVVDKTGVFSLESFVGLNVDEMTLDADIGFEEGLRKLIQRYNRRVQCIEPDPSLLIEVPAGWETE